MNGYICRVSKIRHIKPVNIKDVTNVAFLSLGGNIGNSMAFLETAKTQIEALCGRITLTSGLYKTDAWGSDSKNTYLNQIIQIGTSLNAFELMKVLLSIEEQNGRTRTKNQNSDRTLDIDILYFNSEIIKSEDLIVPHPRLHLRNFILIPFCELAPEFVHPVLGKSMRELLKNSQDTLQVVSYSMSIRLN